MEYEDSIEFTHIGSPTNWSKLLIKINNQNKRLNEIAIFYSS
ncbi:hypothetical protein [Niallia sp. NCCP-28]|nr:hypothetical protein [Niallia sp. NCCP-28]